VVKPRVWIACLVTCAAHQVQAHEYGKVDACHKDEVGSSGLRSIAAMSSCEVAPGIENTSRGSKVVVHRDVVAERKLNVVVGTGGNLSAHAQQSVAISTAQPQ
jgi:hypothetical protein